MKDDTVLVRLQASATRRALGVGVMTALGGLLILTALLRPPAGIGWQIFALLCGLGSLWLGQAMFRATRASVELTREGLRSSEGEWIARLPDISHLERGPFAFKPTNGFLVRLRTGGQAARWRPGLWWRLGPRVGLGGVTPAAQGRVMADMLETLLAERDD